MSSSLDDERVIANGVGLDLAQSWNDILDAKALVAGLTISVAAIAVAIAFLVTPVYRVVTVLLPAEDSPVGAIGAMGDLGALAAMAGLGVSGGDLAVEAEAMLRSRKLTEDLIREKNLLPVIFADKWDAGNARWRVAKGKEPKVSDGFQVFDREIRHVGKDRKTGLISLSIEWSDPVVGAEWARDLVKRVNETMRARALDDTSATIELLKAQLAATSVVSLQDSISDLLKTQIKRQTFAKVRREYALRVVDPAVVPGVDEQIFPRRGMLIAGGTAAGLGLGVFLAIVMGSMRRNKSARHGGTAV